MTRSTATSELPRRMLLKQPSQSLTFCFVMLKPFTKHFALSACVHLFQSKVLQNTTFVLVVAVEDLLVPINVKQVDAHSTSNLTEPADTCGL